MKFDSAILVILGVAAFLAALSGEVYRRTRVNAWSHQQAAFHDEVDLIAASLSSELMHPESCTRILAGLPLVTDGKTPVMLNYSYELEGPLTKNSEITASVGIHELDLEHATHEGDMRTQISDYPNQTLVRWPAQLNLTLEPRHRSAAQVRFEGGQKIPLHFPLYVWTDGEGKILSCFGRQSVGALCNQLGGYYLVDFEDPAPGDQRCRQSAHTEEWHDGHFYANGSCRYLGLVQSAKECETRFAQASTAHHLQDTYKFAQESHQCLLCE